MSQSDSWGGKEASERRRGIEEDEVKLKMARLVARRRRSNLVILVALKKGTIRVKRKWERAEETIYTEQRGTP